MPKESLEVRLKKRLAMNSTQVRNDEDLKVSLDLKELRSLKTQRIKDPALSPIEFPNSFSFRKSKFKGFNDTSVDSDQEKSSSLVLQSKDFRDALENVSIIPQLRKSWIGFTPTSKIEKLNTEDSSTAREEKEKLELLKSSTMRKTIMPAITDTKIFEQDDESDDEVKIDTK